MNQNELMQVMQRTQTLLRGGNTQAAVRVLEQTVKQFPGAIEAWFMLGQIYGSQGRHEAAQKHFAQVIALNNHVPDAHFNLGLSLRNLGNNTAAAESFSQATQLKPDYIAAWYNLGATLLDLDRFAEAEQAFLQVLRFDTSDQIYLALGMSAQGDHRYQQAIAYYNQAVRGGNGSFTLHLNLGTAYFSLHDYEQALKHLLDAHRLDPDNAVAIHNVANCYLELAEIDQALAFYKKSNYPSDETTYLFALNFLQDYDPERVFLEHKAWGEKAVAAAIQPVLPERDMAPERRLKIGYLSADFRQHPVAIFFEQILKNHDRIPFEIYCYADVLIPDTVTARFQGYANHWRDITRFDDRTVAETIRKDGIDILVDLGGHTSERARLLASRNAPVQVNYLGHVNTTGLSTIDYRFTDALLDPPGEADRYCVEKLVRLGNNFFTYNPPDREVAVGPLPALSNGYITFASFNKLYKLNQKTIGLWAKAMAALPGSRMLMVGRAVSTDHGKARVIRLFDAFGIGADRLEFVSFLPLDDYLAQHNHVDLIMDCFPWNGHTTTMHSLWMGVPTITIEGHHHAGRFGYAIMTNLGLPEFIAVNEEDFVERVLNLSKNTHNLAGIRQGLRERLAQSVLCDHRRLTRDIETNYRKMWREWLGNQQAGIL